MTFRQRLGLRLPPILLRLALAATFIWSGSGKFWGPVDLSPAQEATLSAIKAGVAPASTPAPSTEAPNPDDSGDADQGGGAGPTAAASGYQLVFVQNTPDADNISPANSDSPDAAADASAAAAANTGVDDQGQPAEASGSTYHTVDFIALLIHSQATPNDDGKTLLPAFMGQGKWPMYLAYAVGGVELLGGIMIFLGLFTRLWALGLAGVMVGALWMTSIGPVVVYGAPGWPGFLPFLPAIDHFNPGAWMQWILQLNLLAGALSLFCLGAGGASLDRVFFPTDRKPKNYVEDDDE